MKVGFITKSNTKGQIIGVISQMETEDSYHSILKKTQGTWSENWNTLRQKRRGIELAAAKKRRQSW